MCSCWCLSSLPSSLFSLLSLLSCVAAAFVPPGGLVPLFSPGLDDCPCSHERRSEPSVRHTDPHIGLRTRSCPASSLQRLDSDWRLHRAPSRDWTHLSFPSGRLDERSERARTLTRTIAAFESQRMPTHVRLGYRSENTCLLHPRASCCNSTATERRVERGLSDSSVRQLSLLGCSLFQLFRAGSVGSSLQNPVPALSVPAQTVAEWHSALQQLRDLNRGRHRVITS